MLKQSILMITESDSTGLSKSLCVKPKTGKTSEETWEIPEETGETIGKT